MYFMTKIFIIIIIIIIIITIQSHMINKTQLNYIINIIKTIFIKKNVSTHLKQWELWTER